MPVDESPESTSSPALNDVERRVLGVLIEKGLTTPEYYPLTVKALIAGCNQKSNRDPLTHYDEEEVEDALESLERRELVKPVIASTGRAQRWRQEVGRAMDLDAADIAILGELLLRGAQSEGELRARASRMRPIEDLAQLRERLNSLRGRPAALVVRLSPDSSQRGVRWTHGLYRKPELSQILEAEGISEETATKGGLPDTSLADSRSSSRNPPEPGTMAERTGAGAGAVENETSSNLQRRIDDLLQRIQRLEERVQQLEELRRS